MRDALIQDRPRGQRSILVVPQIGMQATVILPLTLFFFFSQFKREELGGGIFQVIAEMLRTGHVFLPYLLFF
jgi:hypothetical protein